jgi:hypothetical protein
MATKLLWKMAMIILGAGLFSRCTGGFSNMSRIPCTRQRPLSSKTALQSAASGKATDVILPSHVRKWLDIELPEGRCVGVAMSAGTDAGWLSENHARNWQWMARAYHPDEIDYGKSLSGSRAESFWLGRLAMRLALDFPEYPILKDSFGRPALDGNVLGSISHKGDCGVALVSHSTSRLAGIGIDLEYTSRPGKKSIAPRVLTDREQRSLGGISGVSVEEEVLLRFRYVQSGSHLCISRVVRPSPSRIFPL